MLLANLFYRGFQLLFRLVLLCFFKNIEITGSHKIPTTGPVVFVGNHANQFVDPLIILAYCPRIVGFLIAASSLKKAVVGWFARQVRSIPVQRAQDCARNGVGRITQVVENGKVKIIGIKWRDQVKIGEQLSVKMCQSTPTVLNVISDTELEVKGGFEKNVRDQPFKIYPKLDQSQVYDTVWKTLIRGDCIGIFPEGGSHDRTELLPLKAGVTIMVLGAMQQDPNLEINIVPVGLNYFSGHRFRSEVIVEFGSPFKVDRNLVEIYQKNKREACGKLLDQIAEQLRKVTLNFPDIESMKIIQTARRLYKPKDTTLTPDQYLELIRRFSEGFVKLRDDPKVKQVAERIQEYNSKLKKYGLKDYQVDENWDAKGQDTYKDFMWNAFYLGLIFIASLPGFILNAPIAGIAKYMALREAKKALQKSVVKISGRDVIASNKIVIGFVLVPIFYTIYSLIVFYFKGWFWALITMMVLPFFSYASVKMMEEGVAVWKSSFPVLLSITKSEYLEAFKQLQQERKQLKLIVRRLVEEMGPKAVDWKHRVIKSEELQKEEDKKHGGILRPRKRMLLSSKNEKPKVK